jgi:RNA polymerase sigma factor (sigma-70 family)
MSNKEELREVIIKAQNGDMEAKDYIVRKYKWLVEKMVRRATGKLDEDLVSIGYRGILMAIDKYDDSVTCAFGTFTEYKIRGVLSNEFANRTRKKRIINEMTISLQTPMEGDNSEGGEDILQDVIAIDNGEEHGYAHIFKDETSSLGLAVKRLTEAQQVLFKMKYLDELNDEQIGLKLGVTKGKITHQIRVLRRDLNDIMGLDYDIPGIKSTRSHKRNRSHLKQEFKLKVS